MPAISRPGKHGGDMSGPGPDGGGGPYVPDVCGPGTNGRGGPCVPAISLPGKHGGDMSGPGPDGGGGPYVPAVYGSETHGNDADGPEVPNHPPCSTSGTACGPLKVCCVGNGAAVAEFPKVSLRASESIISFKYSFIAPSGRFCNLL